MGRDCKREEEAGTEGKRMEEGGKETQTSNLSNDRKDEGEEKSG